MDSLELNKLCAQNDSEGALWRLVRDWDPDAVNRWIQREKKAGTINPHSMVMHVAEVCSGAAFIVGQNLTGDRQGAILGSQGLIARMSASVQHKLSQVGGGHKILLPNGGMHVVPKAK